MSTAIVYPLPPRELTTAHAARRLWEIRFLLRERALDHHAALTSLERLCRHSNPRIAALASDTGCDLADRFLSQS